jgi:hypothetical protein
VEDSFKNNGYIKTNSICKNQRGNKEKKTFILTPRYSDISSEELLLCVSSSSSAMVFVFVSLFFLLGFGKGPQKPTVDGKCPFCFRLDNGRPLNHSRILLINDIPFDYHPPSNFLDLLETFLIFQIF